MGIWILHGSFAHCRRGVGLRLRHVERFVHRLKFGKVISRTRATDECEWRWRGTLLCRLQSRGGVDAITWHMPVLIWNYVSPFKIAETYCDAAPRRFFANAPLGSFRELAALLPLRLPDGTLLPHQNFGYEITAHARWDQRAAAVSLVAANKLPEGVVAFL